jgi:hypothetical protein
VPRKRKRTGSRFKKLLLFIAAPIVIWLLAFVVWFRWSDIVALFNNHGPSPKAPVSQPREEPNPAKARRDETPPEKISEQERTELEQILKRK